MNSHNDSFYCGIANVDRGCSTWKIARIVFIFFLACVPIILAGYTGSEAPQWYTVSERSIRPKNRTSDNSLTCPIIKHINCSSINHGKGSTEKIKNKCGFLRKIFNESKSNYTDCEPAEVILTAADNTPNFGPWIEELSCLGFSPTTTLEAIGIMIGTYSYNYENLCFASSTRSVGPNLTVVSHKNGKKKPDNDNIITTGSKPSENSIEDSVEGIELRRNDILVRKTDVVLPYNI